MSAAYGTPIVRCWDFDPVLGATSRTMTLPASIEKVRVSHELYCVLATDGRSFCWGTNLYGAQGDGSYKQGGGDTLEPQQVRTAERFTDLSVGSTNACGLTQEGKVVCWGNNADGVVGQGHLDRVRGPRTVAVLDPIERLMWCTTVRVQAVLGEAPAIGTTMAAALEAESAAAGDISSHNHASLVQTQNCK